MESPKSLAKKGINKAHQGKIGEAKCILESACQSAEQSGKNPENIPQLVELAQVLLALESLKKSRSSAPTFFDAVFLSHSQTT